MNGTPEFVDLEIGAHGVSMHETRDPGKARALMCSRYRNHHMRHSGSRSGFAFNHISAAVPEGSFNILRYGSKVEIKPEAFQDFFMLEVPISGGVRIEPERGAPFHSCTDQALLIGPQLRFVSTWSKGCAQLMLKIETAQLHRRWQMLVGDQLASLPDVPPQINLQTPEGWRIRQMMLLLQQEMKRCVEFIRTNLDSELSIPVLLAVSETSERTLFNLFRQFMDKTPKAFIRSERLKHCRAILLEGRHSVAEAARLSGFKHMGRFSSQYKAHYGEPPSRTLKH